MSGLIHILVAATSWFIGIFGFSQIIGSIRVRSHIFAIILWSAIIIAVSVFAFMALEDYIWGYVIGMVVAFIMVVCQPTIE